ncbi:MAG: hypothetical protein SPL63_11470 [Roseburia faecis]|nr:hypothetical protein [Roseburia faecis]
MSYHGPTYSDDLENYFARLQDFYTVLPNLKEAKTKDDFLVWYDKLERIDKRSLYIYLHKYKADFNPEFIRLIESRFVKPI